MRACVCVCGLVQGHHWTGSPAEQVVCYIVTVCNQTPGTLPCGSVGHNNVGRYGRFTWQSRPPTLSKQPEHAKVTSLGESLSEHISNFCTVRKISQLGLLCFSWFKVPDIFSLCPSLWETTRERIYFLFFNQLIRFQQRPEIWNPVMSQFHVNSTFSFSLPLIIAVSKWQFTLQEGIPFI